MNAEAHFNLFLHSPFNVFAELITLEMREQIIFPNG